MEKTLQLIVFSLLATLATAAEAQKPNFIIIFTDDQGYQDLGCYGSPNIKTPHIDKMAEEGMKFTSFYAQTVCGPARASLLTGSYPMRIERASHDDGLIPHPAMSLNEITLPELLKEQGYKTGMSGKWDVAGRRTRGAPVFRVELGPHNQGFDDSFWSETSQTDKSVLRVGANDTPLKPKRSDVTKIFTDHAIKFIEENKDAPFFYYLAHPMPHTPIDATPQFKGKSEAGLYGDVIEELDFHTGRLLDKVKELGLDDNTYIIYTSDNGPWWKEGDHAGKADPLRSAKTSTYEGGLRVPFIIRAPGRVPADTSNDLVTATIDLLPSIAKIAGAEVPTDRVLDGIDISEVFHGTQKELDRPFYFYQHQALRAVRQGAWKLHLPHSDLDKTKEGKIWQNHVPEKDRDYLTELKLYNLDKDIAESNNVAKDHPEVVEKLMKQLDFAKKDIGYHGIFGENSRRLKTEATAPKSAPKKQKKNKRKK